MNLLRFFTFGSLTVMLCLMVSMPIFAQEKFNLFDRKNKDSEKKIQRTVEGDLERRIIQAIQSTGDPEEKKHNRAFLYYGVFFIGLAITVAGLVYWQILRRKQMEWKLNDPMALVQELNFVHQLSEQEKQVMQDIAERNALSNVLKLFVDPKFLLEMQEDDAFVPSQSVLQVLLSKLFNISSDEHKTEISSSQVS